MAKFRILATMQTELYLEVEADSKEEALAIGQGSDGADFTEMECSGGWDVYDAYKVDDNNQDDHHE